MTSMRWFGALILGIAVIASSVQPAAAAIDRKGNEIEQNFELAQRLVTAVAALGPDANEGVVLGVIAELSQDVDIVALAAALEIAAQWQEWPEQVLAAFQIAIESALVVLAVRENEATGARVEGQESAETLQLGGYGSSWGAGGAGYSY